MRKLIEKRLPDGRVLTYLAVREHDGATNVTHEMTSQGSIDGEPIDDLTLQRLLRGG